MTSNYAYNNDLPCLNPSCKSEGRPHPNCRCYSRMAEGGEASHFCAENRRHSPDCEYFTDGGPVPPALYAHGGQATAGAAGAPSAGSPMEPPEDIEGALGLSGAHHGLWGMLERVGRAKIADGEKHAKTLKEARESHALMQQRVPAPDTLLEQRIGDEAPRTVGRRIGERVAVADHAGAAGLLEGHPLVGGASSKALPDIMSRLAAPMMAKEPDPEGFKAAAEYLHSAVRGRDRLEAHVARFFEKGAERAEPDRARREKLAKVLDEADDNPMKLLEVGGKLGHYLPEHAVALGAHAAQAVRYLRELKPRQDQAGPLDEPMPVGRAAEASYHRQLDIAADPLLVLQHARHGTVQPQDVLTLNTLYPGLMKRVVKKASERLIEAKTKGQELPYRERQGLSALLGQPLEFVQTSDAARAIVKSAGPQQIQNQQKGKPKSGGQKATAVEMRAIEKSDELTETPLEARLIHRNSR